MVILSFFFSVIYKLFKLILNYRPEDKAAKKEKTFAESAS